MPLRARDVVWENMWLRPASTVPVPATPYPRSKHQLGAPTQTLSLSQQFQALIPKALQRRDASSPLAREARVVEFLTCVHCAILPFRAQSPTKATGPREAGAACAKVIISPPSDSCLHRVAVVSVAVNNAVFNGNTEIRVRVMPQRTRC